MARLREDARFRAVQPDAFDQETHESQGAQAELEDAELDEGLELWFDWAFVEFWKNHYCKPYRSARALLTVPRHYSAVYSHRS